MDSDSAETELGREHFDGLLTDDDRSPDGFKQVVGVNAVLVDPNTGRLVVTGSPNEFHDCDRRGCGSVEHKIGEFDVDKDVFEPIRNHTEGEADE